MLSVNDHFSLVAMTSLSMLSLGSAEVSWYVAHCHHFFVFSFLAFRRCNMWLVLKMIWLGIGSSWNKENACFHKGPLNCR
jgi:hypothetical protein